MQNLETFIVIPAFNESKLIAEVLNELKSAGYSKIIVVDDGSIDNTGELIDTLPVIAIHHAINRGKGAATQTGLDAARKLGAEFIVTMDADAQHDPQDIQNLLEPLLIGKADVALGSRFLHAQNIPFSRKLVNRIGNLITYIFYGIYVSDSQSGMRAYNRKANDLIRTTFDRYEFESEVLQQIQQHNLAYVEVPINVRYSDHSLNKYRGLKVEGQSFLNGFRMIFRMIIRSITT